MPYTPDQTCVLIRAVQTDAPHVDSRPKEESLSFEPTVVEVCAVLVMLALIAFMGVLNAGASTRRFDQGLNETYARAALPITPVVADVAAVQR